MDENQSNSTFTVIQGFLKIWRLGIVDPVTATYEPHVSADDRYFSVQRISVVGLIRAFCNNVSPVRPGMVVELVIQHI